MKKTTIVAIILIIVLGVFALSNQKKPAPGDKIVVGAILPMSGPLAAYGEQFRVGMNLALADLDPEHKIELKIEDSQGTAAGGLSAFNKLSGEGVDILTANLSRVAIPLRDLAQQKKIPFLMSLVSSMDATNSSNPYALRLFHNAETIVKTYLKAIQLRGWKNVAVIYVNDEFGTSVNKEFQRYLADADIKSEYEGFASDVNDYRTIIEKIRPTKPDAVVFVSIPPASLLNFIKQSAETKLNVPIMDGAGIVPGSGGLKILGSAAEGLYTFAGPFDLGIAGQSLGDALKKNNISNSYAAAYAYDVIKYIVEAKRAADAQHLSLLDGLHSIKEFSGMEGIYTITGSDIQPNLTPVQVKGGKFIEVK